MKSLRWRSVSLMTVAAFVVAGCGGGGGDSSASSEISGRGPITFATGKDVTGAVTQAVETWNGSHPEQRVRLIELPADGDQQRQQMVQNAQTESGAFTVLDLDNVWNAEFAANRWVVELPKEEFDFSPFLESAMKTARYRGRLFSVPAYSDGGLLYYRKDLLNKVDAQPPTTREEMREICAKVLELPAAEGMSCYAGQHAKYEGLTVNFAEAVHGAGGQIVNDQGQPTVDSPEALRGLETMVEGFGSGTIPRAAIAYKEQPNKRAFIGGELVFSRNWPFMWSQANADDGSSKVAGEFAVAPLPGITGKGVSSLGGHNLAISSFAENKATALDFIKFYTSEKQQRQRLIKGSLAPTRGALYDDPELQRKYPYLDTLKKSIKSAEPRPRVVNYGDVTLAVQDEVYAAISGDKKPDKALSALQRRLEKLIEQK
ncbi:carbohydrate ABC transporter substrate-binding protein, CUT1 family (TC 3.A.1.1.-) [Actinopolyspora lacussalsi subsp. righensis]|uniref:Carbohydrate ABC transporter substrate-binding protein, CUT1 family (TC 3.A.1.1.-) n=1 Tax=Actinopolyspora righensis TaxID=995060 RepID=A0A1I6XAM9_9ACTN|nr:ABC transporter substrate-binding protein [Actinopolyspora righensis]SFT34854.1 carbohydrate ABC transporter substrate-binding protein, CUT1 family (TC 3.A.1.1.-) [Actinopolyspora righensis]